MNSVTLESVVIVHGREGSVATIHFSDNTKSCYLSSSSRQVLYSKIEKTLEDVLND